MADSGRASSAPKDASPAVDPLVGRIIEGRFKITGVIAKGGMGKVYRAEQAPLGRVCAVKILTANYQGEHDPEFHKRFFLEASIASKITHPNSVTIFDYGHTDDDVYYMAMEYLEGVTLHRAIRQSGPFNEDRMSHIARQICRALREAHALGCIHRDLKPANVFLTHHGDEHDFVKVLDFGLVKNVLGEVKPEDQLTQTGLFMGSPKYMAPEQIRGEKVDARTDVYSLGIIMYEMLAGKVPFDRPTSLNILMAQVNDTAPRISDMNPEVRVSPEIEELVLRCLAKDPTNRVGSMDEVLTHLKRIGPSAGQTGEYGAVSSGHYARLSTTGPQSAQGAPASAGSGNPQSVPPDPSGRSISVTLSAPHTTPPSMTPVADSAGGSVGATHGSIPPPDFRPGNTGRNVVLVAVGLAAAAGVAVFAMHRTPEPVVAIPAPLVPVSAATPPPLSPPTATAPTPPPAPTTVTVHFLSDPAGASVKENGTELCAATPCDHEFPIAGFADHKVLLWKAGFKPEMKALRSGDTQVAVTLAPARAWVPPAANAGRSSKPAEPGQTPQGFKDIPY